MIKAHPAYRYAQKVLKGEVKAPKYVILQCAEFIQVANGKSRKYIIDEDKLDQIMRLLRASRLSTASLSTDCPDRKSTRLNSSHSQQYRMASCV